ncbi:hypothetical protein RSAG8_01643, partial [Rhizoctonia solani AG-8 WAC10335]
MLGDQRLQGYLPSKYSPESLLYSESPPTFNQSLNTIFSSYGATRPRASTRGRSAIPTPRFALRAPSCRSPGPRSSLVPLSSPTHCDIRALLREEIIIKHRSPLVGLFPSPTRYSCWNRSRPLA